MNDLDKDNSSNRNQVFDDDRFDAIVYEDSPQLDTLLSPDLQPQHNEVENFGVHEHDDLPVKDIQEESRNLNLNDSERLKRFCTSLMEECLESTPVVESYHPNVPFPG